MIAKDRARLLIKRLTVTYENRAQTYASPRLSLEVNHGEVEALHNVGNNF